MRKLLALGFMAAIGMATTSAYAVPQIGMKILVDGTEVSSQPLTAGGGGFTLSYDSSIFSSITVSASGAPTVPDPNFSTVSMNATSSFSGGTHTLSLIMTQINLTGADLPGLASTFTYNALFNSSNVTSALLSNYIDTGNAAYAQTTLIGSTPNEGTALTYASGYIEYKPAPGPLFSETEIVQLTFKGQAQVLTTDQIIGVPEPVSVALLGSGLVTLAGVRGRRRKTA